MSDPRNAAHAKKVTQEKKHKKSDAAAAAAAAPDTGGAAAAQGSVPVAAPPAALEGSLVVLAQLKELEFHSRANLERLAALTLTVDDELKQKEMVGPLGEVYAAQSTFQTRLTALIEAYKAECDGMQGGH